MKEFNGKKYWKSKTCNYYYTDHIINGIRIKGALHRDIWSHHNGAIPDGYAVHHLDGDPENNDVANLTIMPRGQHQREHLAERYADPDIKAQTDKLLSEIRPLASLWHGSPEGIEWHSQHGKNTWVGREPVIALCTECGEEYKTFFPSRSRFCSTKCAQRTIAKSGKYHTDARVCLVCHKEFMAVPSSGKFCCCRKCAGQYRAEQRRLKEQ